MDEPSAASWAHFEERKHAFALWFAEDLAPAQQRAFLAFLGASCCPRPDQRQALAAALAGRAAPSPALAGRSLRACGGWVDAGPRGRGARRHGSAVVSVSLAGIAAIIT